MKNKSLDIKRAKALAAKFREESERYSQLARRIEDRVEKNSQGEKEQGKYGLTSKQKTV